jgi:hypothetical protein
MKTLRSWIGMFVVTGCILAMALAWPRSARSESVQLVPTMVPTITASVVHTHRHAATATSRATIDSLVRVARDSAEAVGRSSAVPAHARDTAHLATPRKLSAHPAAAAVNAPASMYGSCHVATRHFGLYALRPVHDANLRAALTESAVVPGVRRRELARRRAAVARFTHAELVTWV